MSSKALRAVLLAVGFCLSAISLGQQTTTVGPYMAVLKPNAKGFAVRKEITLDLFIMDSSSMAPIQGLTLTASLSMPSMAGMSMQAPKVSAGALPGHFDVIVMLPHIGEYKLNLIAKSAAGSSTVLSFNLSPNAGEKHDAMPGMGDMSGMRMKANLGDWPANREGSGTSWQPDSSPMFMVMLPSYAGFELSTMGSFNAGYVDAGGSRGDKSFFSDSMIMLMARKETGGGTLGLDFMTSLDPILDGERGVPNLFQTGETANSVPLVDRQHPHNLFSELAASYSHPLSLDWSGFVYGGPVGEPALGDVMFMHRASGMEVPEAPITHHWFDSTHISFGVATLGLVYKDKWKFDGSVFNGHEPGENRYTIGPEALNSASGRVTYNPGRDWSLSTSYGYLDSPEALNPGVNEHRLTLSAAFSHDLPHGDNVSATAYWGQNIVEGNPTPSNAFLAEATYFHAKDAFFARFERVEKDELFNVPPGNYTINKLLFGDVHNVRTKDQLEYGIGAYVGLYSFPGSLDALYGRNPVTFGVFLRIRPAKM